MTGNNEAYQRSPYAPVIQKWGGRGGGELIVPSPPPPFNLPWPCRYAAGKKGKVCTGKYYAQFFIMGFEWE